MQAFPESGFVPFKIQHKIRLFSLRGAKIDLEHIGTGNRLLSALSDAAIEKISPHLSRVWLEPGSALSCTEQGPDYAYFPESGIVAVSTPAAEGRLCCIGLYGFEGCGSLAAILGAPTSSTFEVVQMSGYAIRVPTEVLLQAFATLPEVRSLMLRYVHVFMMQLANTVLANSAHIEQRLARWLLMYQDRIRGISLAVTHQALSSMLGVRRAGVTEAIHVLEGRKMIRSQRGLINILDRPRLEMMTAGSYGGPEAEYRRLILRSAATPNGHHAPATGHYADGPMKQPRPGGR